MRFRVAPSPPPLAHAQGQERDFDPDKGDAHGGMGRVGSAACRVWDRRRSAAYGRSTIHIQPVRLYRRTLVRSTLRADQSTGDKDEPRLSNPADLSRGSCIDPRPIGAAIQRSGSDPLQPTNQRVDLATQTHSGGCLDGGPGDGDGGQAIANDSDADDEADQRQSGQHEADELGEARRAGQRLAAPCSATCQALRRRGFCRSRAAGAEAVCVAPESSTVGASMPLAFEPRHR